MEERDSAPSHEELAESSDKGNGREGVGVDSELLAAVLQETVATSDRASLNLILDVARESQYPDTTDIRAVDEVVRAIVDMRFGKLRFSDRMISRISRTLIEDPEAAVKLERLWQEARVGG